LSVMLFLGPTGVGKTETVRVLAEAIYGDADHFCRVDMNTLSQQHYAAALSGAPPGYVGSKEGHTLFNKELVAGSFSKPGIVLFDEIEKADRDVARTLLNILDHGMLQLAGGVGEIDFRNALVFMTSNIGAPEVMAASEPGVRRFLRKTPFGISNAEIYKRSLRRHFDPEFLNRLHSTIVFDEIGADQLDILIDLELKKLRRRLKPQGAEVRVTTEVRTRIKSAYDRQYGARDLARGFRQNVEVPLAKGMLLFPQANDFIITEKEGDLIAEPLQKQ
jgi:ATP-dependent Clp protease ATP-binding subunit ClpA